MSPTQLSRLLADAHGYIRPPIYATQFATATRKQETKMRRFHVFAFVLVAALFGACSTTITTRQNLEHDVAGQLKFGAVDATSALGAVTADDLAQLKKAVVERIAKLPQGGRTVSIQLTVTEMDIVSGGARFFAGAFAGNNKMTAVVKVIDESGKTVVDFDVQRATNPGGYGIFFDQKAATIDSVADGVAEVLSGKNGGGKGK